MSEGKSQAGRIVLVMGGGAGIGAATVRAFAAEGATVIVADRQPPAALPEAACLLQADVMREEDVAAAVAETVKRFGSLDVAINVAGGVVPPDKSGPMLHEVALEGWRATLEVSLTGTFLCMKHQLAQMLRQGHGVIANTASAAGLLITPRATPAYHAAKAGLIHLTRDTAVKYADKGIRINVVAPGLTATERQFVGAVPAEESARIATQQPIGRMVTPEEVAAAFLWVCSPAASGVTGITVPVDGGWSAR